MTFLAESPTAAAAMKFMRNGLPLHNDALAPDAIKASAGTKLLQPNDAESASAEYWIKKINDRYKESKRSVFYIGETLLKAQQELAHGYWTPMFEKGLLPFSQRTAQKYMKIARNSTLSKATNSAHLPRSVDAISMLTQIKTEELQTLISDGKIYAEMTIAQASHLVDSINGKAMQEASPANDYNHQLKLTMVQITRRLKKVPMSQRAKFGETLIEQIRTELIPAHNK